MLTKSEKTGTDAAAEKKRVEVAAGIIYDDRGRVLVCRRGTGKNPDTDGKWEFPGGKLEPGETPRDAVCRELREELQIDVFAGRRIAVVEYEYPTFFIKMHCVECRMAGGEPHITEHAEMRWVDPSQLPALDFCPADEPVLPLL